MRKLQIIAGVPIDDLTMDQAVERIEGFIASGHPHQIATVNADFVIKARHDPELCHILQVADMLTPDGMPLVWGARLLGVPLEGRVTGADMVPALAKVGAHKGWRFYFLGAGPGIAARAAEVLTERYPGLQVVGIYSPPKSSVVELDPAIVDRVREAHPDVLLVAFGNPKQEKWIHMYQQELGVPVAIGIGGTFDFIAGETQRAPAWMQEAGLEWLFRLIQEPRRLWRRYVVDLVQFTRFFVQQWWMQQRGQSFSIDLPDTSDPEPSPAPPAHAVVAVGESLTVANRESFIARADQALSRDPHLILDLSETSFVDSAGMGTLVDLTRRARAAGGDVRLTSIQPQVRRTMELLRLDQFLSMDDSLGESVAAMTQAETSLIKLSYKGHWTVMALSRRLEVGMVKEVRSEGERALDESPYLVVDLSETEYLDSAGIAALLALHRKAESAAGELRLAGMQQPVRRTLELASIAPILAIYGDLETALEG